MDCSDLLNLILAHTCVSEKEGEVRVFHLDLCCYQAEIKAELISEGFPVQYKVISADFKTVGDKPCLCQTCQEK